MHLAVFEVVVAAGVVAGLETVDGSAASTEAAVVPVVGEVVHEVVFHRVLD